MPRKAVGTKSTLKQVADAAGVSIAAASKVLNGRGSNVRIGEDRAQAIREVAERLRYSPNALASSLRMSKTHTIGLIWEHMQSIAEGPLYYVYLLDGVSRTVFSRHYRLTILPEIPSASPLRAIADGRLDGAIWCKMPPDPCLAEEINHSGFKVVGLNSPPAPDGEYVSVACDNQGGAGLVVDHLVGLGHRRILFVLDEGWEGTPDAVERLKGFRRALDRHGIPFSMSEDTAVWDIRRPVLADWHARETAHTALFCWHDGVAAGVLQAAMKAGIEVPRELSVVGFDSTVFCDSTLPRLTSVRQPIIEMAEKAAELLLDLVEGRPVPVTSHVFPCTLDIRSSTSSPAPRSVPRLTEEVSYP